MARTAAAAAAYLLLVCLAGAEVVAPDGTRPCQGPAEACPDVRDDTVQLQIKRRTEDTRDYRRDPEVMTSLVDCVRKEFPNERIIGKKDSNYTNAKKLVNDWDDTPAGVEPQLKPKPLGVVRPESVAQVQQVVSCAAQFGFQCCAAAGQHGWDNEGACDGGIMVDVQDLMDFEIDQAAKTVRFGAGNWLGRLYQRLHSEAELYIPVGVVNSVGAGLILGCGRGLATTVLGLACDSLLSVRYIDATGAEQIADATTNPDMYWMARGGAGEFPGIVVEYTMQAYTSPGHVSMYECDYTDQGSAEAALKKWFTLQEDMLVVKRKVYTTATLFNSKVTKIKVYCLGCGVKKKMWALEQMEAIDDAAGSSGSCSDSHRSWLDHILYESGAPAGTSADWLLDRENGWGKGGDINTRIPTIANGRVDTTFNVTSELIHAITSNCWYGPGETDAMFCGIYPISGEKVTSVGPTDTAYGNRDASWSLHFKYGMLKGQQTDYYNHFKEASSNFQKDLDMYMPCRNFYNYIDTDNMDCLGEPRGSDAWLAAYFSNVTRMREIKAAVDPDDVIRTIGMSWR